MYRNLNLHFKKNFNQDLILILLNCTVDNIFYHNLKKEGIISVAKVNDCFDHNCR